MAHSLTLTPEERARCQQMGVDPDDYVALPVDLAVDEAMGCCPKCGTTVPRPGGIAQLPMPGGVLEVVVVPMNLVLPADALRRTRILLASKGQVEHPLTGMIPAMTSRALVPRIRVKPETLAQFGEPAANSDFGPAPIGADLGFAFGLTSNEELEREHEQGRASEYENPEEE